MVLLIAMSCGLCELAAGCRVVTEVDELVERGKPPVVCKRTGEVKQAGERVFLASLAQGERLTVALPANKSTGFSWQVVGEYPEAGLAFEEKTYRQSAKAAVRRKLGETGVGGEELLTFLAKNPGRARLVLEYRRPWERDVLPLYVNTYEVEISAQAR